jgi:hypothetical protein
LKLEVLSYSFDPEWSHLLHGDALGVTGLIVNRSLISRRAVENWMTHEGLDVDWRPCRRDKDPRVNEFLTQSALHDDFFAARAAGGAARAHNLRVDKIGQSAPKRNGRPPKRPQPDAGFNDAADGGRMLTPAHARPAPAGSTPPDAAAAAGAGGAAGRQPSPPAPAKPAKRVLSPYSLVEVGVASVANGFFAALAAWVVEPRQILSEIIVLRARILDHQVR